MSTATHSALAIHEILLEIFRHTTTSAPASPASPSRRTADLASLARVCRAFTHPATALLWRRLSALAPLLALLPPGPPPRPSSEAWHRVRAYARHIRVLSFDEAREPGAGARLLEILEAAGGELVFKRLGTVWWDATTPAGVHALAGVLGPAVRDLSVALEVDGTEVEGAVGRVCEAVGKAGSRLRHLSVGSSSGFSEISASRLLALLSTNAELVSVHFDDALAHHPALLPAVHGLVRLESLHLTLRHGSAACLAVPARSSGRPLPALRTLILDGDPSAIAAYTRALPPAPNAEAVVTLFTRPEGAERAELADALSRVCGAMERVQVMEALDSGEEGDDLEAGSEGDAVHSGDHGDVEGNEGMPAGDEYGSPEDEDEDEDEDDVESDYDEPPSLQVSNATRTQTGIVTPSLDFLTIRPASLLCAIPPLCSRTFLDVTVVG